MKLTYECNIHNGFDPNLNKSEQMLIVGLAVYLIYAYNSSG